MPRVFDNIDLRLLPALCETMAIAQRADFCVGYLNLRGWKHLDSFVEGWPGGEGHCCRLLVGMQDLPQDELRMMMSLEKRGATIDNQTAVRLKKRLATELREQLTLGLPTAEDEAALRRLAKQLKSRKVTVKLFLRHRLHAKLYLCFRQDPNSPIVAFLGSSNLTFPGLAGQGELNVDVLDQDAGQKLACWFEDRWNDRFCLDISDELVQILAESWARPDLISPYHIYVKMAYHLSQEARSGLAQFTIPKEFQRRLTDFQMAAVKIAAHHLNKRNGVLIGDVVGFGKTLMATALARIMEDDLGLETLIICPKNLVKMWNDYVYTYRLRATVLSLSRVIQGLPDLRRYRLVVIDESHNLRNPEGRRYRAIHDYIQKNESKVVMLSATPYNKTYLDLSSQLRLFVPEDQNLGVRPEKLLRELGETEFRRRHQCPVHSLAAFEQSEYADDWRELMRLYMVRRTRTFIQNNYAYIDCPHCGTVIPPTTARCPQCQRTKTRQDRYYIAFADGTRYDFPQRLPRKVPFTIDEQDPKDHYARLYAPTVVDTINALCLPRYGLGNYIAPTSKTQPTPDEQRALGNLSRAGKRLMGFCRTNLFKRLESSGQAFLLSVTRHILRNYVYLHAIENRQPLPIGTQDAGMLDSRVYDGDADATAATVSMFDDDEENGGPAESTGMRTEEDFRRCAAEVYQQYTTTYRRRYKWLRPDLFVAQLEADLRRDALNLLQVLKLCGEWDPKQDAKLAALTDLLARDHPRDKVLIFTQFADTVQYLETQLQKRGIPKLAGVTGSSDDPTGLAWRFSPESNGKREQVSPADELRVLVATDVLSEGQNLQDCAIVVNYDLPWAIIRLVQRAGRVDRLGQMASQILCYSFLPADGVERIIRLRARVRQRLQENAEVVGSDESFFEDDRNDQAILDLYSEKAGLLDGESDTEVDLTSYAYQIWKNAITVSPALQKIVSGLPPVVYATRRIIPSEVRRPGPEPGGVMVYVRTAQGNDALAWVDQDGQSVTESEFAILRAAECAPDTPALPRQERHHELVQKGVELVTQEEKSAGGQLGRPSGARFRTYERLKHYAEEIRGQLWDTPELHRAIEEILHHPLRSTAVDTLNRQLRSGISDEALAELVVALRNDDRLCLVEEGEQEQEPRIICSLGLV